jgi:hypothetical protein
VRCLHRYLERFGYLASPVLSELASADLAEAAPTGQLDDATLQLMNTPRRGFPDTAEFVLQGNKWSAINLRYGFEEFTPDITEAQTRAGISTALGYWAAVTPLTFSEVPVASNPELRIRLRPVAVFGCRRNQGEEVDYVNEHHRR